MSNYADLEQIRTPFEPPGNRGRDASYKENFVLQVHMLGTFPCLLNRFGFTQGVRLFTQSSLKKILAHSRPALGQ